MHLDCLAPAYHAFPSWSLQHLSQFCWWQSLERTTVQWKWQMHTEEMRFKKHSRNFLCTSNCWMPTTSVLCSKASVSSERISQFLGCTWKNQSPEKVFSTSLQACRKILFALLCTGIHKFFQTSMASRHACSKIGWFQPRLFAWGKASEINRMTFWKITSMAYGKGGETKLGGEITLRSSAQDRLTHKICCAER